MKSRREILLGVVAVAAALGVVARAEAQEGGGPPTPKPTAEHKIVTADEGTWDATIKSYMNGPDAPPSVSKGTEVNTVMAGGLWLLSKFQGDFGGIPFEGHGQFGYDTVKKAYVGTWIDSMTPTLSILEGSYDPKTRTMTFVGEGVDPMSKSKFTQKMVTVTNEDGTRAFTLYIKAKETGDKEAKMLEISYKKRK